MRPELNAIQETFERYGWTSLQLHGSEVLQAVFVSSYATAGILIADGVDQVLQTWEAAQENLRELRIGDPALREKDAYLVIVVPRVDVQADSLREVLDNTYVCRKICVEFDGKTTEEALKELPFFSVVTNNDRSRIEAEIRTSSQDLPEQLLQDLRKASAEVVLDGLLQGKYGFGG